MLIFLGHEITLAHAENIILSIIFFLFASKVAYYYVSVTTHIDCNIILEKVFQNASPEL